MKTNNSEIWKMVKILFLIVIGACLCFYIYGIIFKILNIEKNECQMTYMLEYPYYGVSFLHRFLNTIEVKS